MPYLDSDQYRVWIGDGGGTEVYYEMPGQKGIEYAFSADKIDQTVKADSWETSRPGLKKLTTFAIDVMPSLPDTHGYSHLEAQFLAKAATDIQVRKNGSSGASPADVVFAASMFVSDLGNSAQPKTNVATKISLYLAAAPTTNALA